MEWNNIICSGHTFTQDEYALESKYVVTYTMMIVVATVLRISFAILKMTWYF